MAMMFGWSVDRFAPHWFISATVWCTAIKLHRGIQAPHKLKPAYFCDPPAGSLYMKNNDWMEGPARDTFSFPHATHCPFL